jgi:hypothetical protein
MFLKPSLASMQPTYELQACRRQIIAVLAHPVGHAIELEVDISLLLLKPCLPRLLYSQTSI